MLLTKIHADSGLERETLPSDFLSFLSADSIPTLTPAQVRRLCYVALHIVASVTLDEPAMRAEWQELFSALAESLCSPEHDANTADHHRALARHSSQRMYALDTGAERERLRDGAALDVHIVDYDGWLVSPSRKRSIFGDDLVLYWCRLNPHAGPRDIALLEREHISSSQDE